jgi:light-regulated signal transduction histidine kinase (bacteriophytochrome)
MEHGGKIYVKSQLGEGATFVVELSVASGETRKGKAAKKKSTRKNNSP